MHKRENIWKSARKVRRAQKDPKYTDKYLKIQGRELTSSLSLDEVISRVILLILFLPEQYED